MVWWLVAARTFEHTHTHTRFIFTRVAIPLSKFIDRRAPHRVHTPLSNNIHSAFCVCVFFSREMRHLFLPTARLASTVRARLFSRTERVSGTQCWHAESRLEYTPHACSRVCARVSRACTRTCARSHAQLCAVCCAYAHTRETANSI